MHGSLWGDSWGDNTSGWACRENQRLKQSHRLPTCGLHPFGNAIGGWGAAVAVAFAWNVGRPALLLPPTGGQQAGDTADTVSVLTPSGPLISCLIHQRLWGNSSSSASHYPRK